MIRKTRRFRLTIVHPCVGRRRGRRRYVRTWEMESIPSALIAALVPTDIEKRFYDDRFETIPFDEPTDLVAISVETYTARRAYQIASDYRSRGVPVVMGGYHATLCPDEVSTYADSTVIGEVESIFTEIIDDYRSGRPRKIYRASARPALTVLPDRSIFRGKRYLPIRLVEFARGCRFKCDFCSIQAFHRSTHRHRPLEQVLEEIHQVQHSRQMIFFIDDNITSGLDEAKQLMHALIPLKIRWVGQTAIDAAHDDETLRLMKRSGCQGVLIGIESLDRNTLEEMNKGFNFMKGGPAQALANMRKHRLAVYGTFIFGYDHDTPESIAASVEFAKEHGLFVAAFNHITPFPGTPLYERLSREGRLLHETWWLDDGYRYNMVPFHPRSMTASDLAELCVRARHEFYSWQSVVRRAKNPVNRRNAFAAMNYLAFNVLHRRDLDRRNHLPLGDANWQGTLRTVQ